ncbi:MAG: hypothetical protein INQ03_24660 [Candidatus Heimdallarchaeota archaeon]|nr:hypothetical protein [Candidatus Heimdallarchaeota archaeon]
MLKHSEIGLETLYLDPEVSRGFNTNHTFFEPIITTAKELEITLQF